MDEDRNTCSIGSVLDQARREINRNRADLALEILRSILNEMDDRGDPIEKAQYQLLLAEAYAAQNNEAADSFFHEAKSRICLLPNRELGLEVRLFEHYAKFLIDRRPSEAKNFYCRAESVAQEIGDKEQIARIELEKKVLDFKQNRNPELNNLRILRRVAANGNYTSREQLAAWHQHFGEIESSSKVLRFARKLESRDESYFKKLLESIRKSGL
jgi:hypothetical protein